MLSKIISKRYIFNYMYAQTHTNVMKVERNYLEKRRLARKGNDDKELKRVQIQAKYSDT